MTHAEFKPHAFITLSNVGGIEIMLNRSNDGVFYRFNYGQDNIEDEYIYEAEIEHVSSVDEDDEVVAGFWHYNTGNDPAEFYSLSSAMRLH